MTGTPDWLAAGRAALHAGRPAEAERYGQAAVEAEPGRVDGWLLLGVACQCQGRLGHAEQCFRRALALRPTDVGALVHLGNALQFQGQPGEAVECFRRAGALRPDLPEVHYNLANALHDDRRPAEAVESYRRALALRPDFAAALVNLGNALRGAGRPEEALEPLRQALALWPDSAEAQTNLGAALYDLGRLDEAVACNRHALRHRPDFPEAHANLGGALRDLGRLTEAEEALRRALALRPDYPDALNNLGNVLRAQGRPEEAVSYYRRALALQPVWPMVHSNLLLTLHYQVAGTPVDLAAEHADYQRRLGAPLRGTWRPHANDRDPDRPLRLGLVSPDFGRHPVGYLLVGAVEALAQRPGAVVCYSNRRITDDLTARFRAAAAAWRDTAGLPDEALAEQVRADGIDVLIDLAGHTAGNRLLTFARKPAPVQMTWLGYEGTTGLEAIDYLIADDRLIPPGSEAHCWETVLRLPGGYACYDPPADAPEPGPPPALASGRVTFGCFNNPAKLSLPALAAFAAVLSRVPGARLLLKYTGLDDPTTGHWLRERLTAAGIELARVELHGSSPHGDYLAAYQDVDIALDPFPFAGGVTTCDALWMGVPVVTLPGPTFASRHGLSYLASAGLADECVRWDADGYVARAVDLASDLDQLIKLRAGLRERVARSPFCDGGRLADELLAVLGAAWRASVAGERR
jgi:predicted O-linked N-acetylglucosamine transferase (SPINDLY family)